MLGTSQVVQPPVRAAAMNLYPVMGSLREVLEWAEGQMPITSKNQLLAVLGTYHNTLLKQLNS